MNNKSADLTGHTIKDGFNIDYITDDYDGYAILATRDPSDIYELVGIAYTQNIDVSHNYNSTFIYFIGILEEYRGLGIGTEALSLIVEDIKK